MTEVFSSATMGKGLLEDLGIKPFLETNPKFQDEMLGKIAQSYYGGRCECRIRKTPMKVSVLDFTSMYPTLFMLLGLYDFLTAEIVEYNDDTENVQKFINEIKLEDLKRPETWKKLNVIVELEPVDDLLPIRSKYDKDEDSFTVGLNYLTTKEPIFYGLPSIILSKLMTGKVPKIKRAICFSTIGKQKLKKIRLLGIEIDPNKQNIFKILVEKRQEYKNANDKRHKMIKILVNATSYGIYFQLDREDKKSDVIVYTGDKQFENKKYFEKAGRYYHPIIASMITDGAKLLLGLGDCILQKHNEVVAYCDTDSLFIPTKYKEEITKFFDSLNPYDKKTVPYLLKTDEESIWYYGISAKRYVLFNKDKRGKITINETKTDEDYSLHGLGHLLNPFGKEEGHWQSKYGMIF
jgi:hypothetical protein